MKNLAFQIYYKTKTSEIYSLDITCKDAREYDLWMIGVKALHAHFNDKIICKNDLLNHSKAYCQQIKISIKLTGTKKLIVTLLFLL